MTNLDLATALRAYARYAGVVADQLEALDRGDAARQWVLEHERTAAEREVERLLDRADGQVEQVLAAAIVAIGGAAAERTLVRGRIAQLDEDARRAAQLAALTRPAWASRDRELAAELGASTAAVVHLLDVSR